MQSRGRTKSLTPRRCHVKFWSFPCTKNNKLLLFALLVFFLVGCSEPQTPPVEGGQKPVSVDGAVQKCYVHEDYYSCTLTNGRTYYVTREYAEEVLASKTTWDKTAWSDKE